GSLADLGAVVVDAVGDHRPAVVLAGLGVIQFGAATRAVLDGPEPTGHRMHRRALQVAVAVRPDLRHRACATHERIVIWDGAVAVDPHDLADAGGEIL